MYGVNGIFKLLGTNVTLINNKLEIYVACWHKINFHKLSLRTDDPISDASIVIQNGFKPFGFNNYNGSFDF